MHQEQMQHYSYLKRQNLILMSELCWLPATERGFQQCMYHNVWQFNWISLRVNSKNSRFGHLGNPLEQHAQHSECKISTGVKNFYLVIPFDQYKYIRMPLDIIPEELIQQYHLIAKAMNGYVCMKTRKRIYCLSKAGIYAKSLRKRITKHEYYEVPLILGLWKHRDHQSKLTLWLFILEPNMMESNMQSIDGQHSDKIKLLMWIERENSIAVSLWIGIIKTKCKTFWCQDISKSNWKNTIILNKTNPKTVTTYHQPKIWCISPILLDHWWFPQNWW